MAKKGRGRPAHQPNDATKRAVEILAASGLYQYQIAAQMKMDEDTLVKYYEYELEAGWATNMKKATNIVIKRIEADGDEALDAAKFFLSRRGKGLWSEQKNLELSGPNGGAIPIAPIDLDAIDYEELEAAYEIIAPALLTGPVAEAELEDDDSDAETA